MFQLHIPAGSWGVEDPISFSMIFENPEPDQEVAAWRRLIWWPSQCVNCYRATAQDVRTFRGHKVTKCHRYHHPPHPKSVILLSNALFYLESTQPLFCRTLKPIVALRVVRSLSSGPSNSTATAVPTPPCEPPRCGLDGPWVPRRATAETAAGTPVPSSSEPVPSRSLAVGDIYPGNNNAQLLKKKTKGRAPGSHTLGQWEFCNNKDHSPLHFTSALAAMERSYGPIRSKIWMDDGRLLKWCDCVGIGVQTTSNKPPETRLSSLSVACALATKAPRAPKPSRKSWVFGACSKSIQKSKKR